MCKSDSKTICVLYTNHMEQWYYDHGISYDSLNLHRLLCNYYVIIIIHQPISPPLEVVIKIEILLLIDSYWYMNTQTLPTPLLKWPTIYPRYLHQTHKPPPPLAVPTLPRAYIYTHKSNAHYSSYTSLLLYLHTLPPLPHLFTFTTPSLYLHTATSSYSSSYTSSSYISYSSSYFSSYTSSSYSSSYTSSYSRLGLICNPEMSLMCLYLLPVYDPLRLLLHSVHILQRIPSQHLEVFAN